MHQKQLDPGAATLGAQGQELSRRQPVPDIAPSTAAQDSERKRLWNEMWSTPFRESTS